MMTFFATFVAICFVYKTGVDAIVCKNYDLSVRQPVETSINCTDPRNGDNIEKCLLRVVTNTTSSQSGFWKSCMKKVTPETVCGQTAPSKTTPGISIKYCCCGTDNCNDDAFGQQCSGTTPTLMPTTSSNKTTMNTTLIPTTSTTPEIAAFKCYMSKEGKIGRNKTVESCPDQKCTFAVALGNNTLVELEYGCIDSKSFENCGSNFVNTKFKNVIYIGRMCCCDTPLCNDEKFAKQCRDFLSPSSALKDSAGIVVLLLSLLLSSIVTFF